MPLNAVPSPTPDLVVATSSTAVVDTTPPRASSFDRSHVAETGNRFAELNGLMRAEGLLDMRPGRYVLKIAVNTLMIAAGLVAFVELGASWWQLLVAVWMGFCGGQSAFVWHDAAHKAMFRSKKAATFVGRIHANLVNGVSYEWWVNHHNRHHSFPNHLENDPDIGRRTVIFHRTQYGARSRRGKFIVRHQRLLFFVLLVFEGLKLHRTGYRAVKGKLVKHPVAESALLIAHVVVFLGAVFWVLDPLQAVAFVFVQQAVLGVYFGMLFAPNHKGMPVRTDAESLDWLDRQVLTSRNIKPSPLVDFMYGGLNYQVEHHLFPTMPQMNLGRCRVIVREYCERMEIPYYEVGFVQSYREVADYLFEISEQVREDIAVAPRPA